jgi:hypothetical protein
MRISSHFAYWLSSAAVAALLTGCSGGGAQFPAANAPVTRPGQFVQKVQSVQTIGVNHDSSTSVLPRSAWLPKVALTRREGFVNVAGVNALHGNETIISEIAFNTVSVYGRDGQLNALLTIGLSEPQGLATDAAENLYVANTLKSNIVIYAKPYTSPSLTLNDANQLPSGVAVSQTGIVGVTNIQSVAGNAGSVSVYAKGSTVACATVSNPNWSRVYFDAFDASGNLFVDGQDLSGNTLIGEVSGGCSATSITTLTVGNTVLFPGGVQVLSGKILIDDQLVPAIYTYAPPKGGSLGSPTATTMLLTGTDPVTFAMKKSGDALWAASNVGQAGGFKYTYPGGQFIKSITDGFIIAIGIAVNPAAKP